MKYGRWLQKAKLTWRCAVEVRCYDNYIVVWYMLCRKLLHISLQRSRYQRRSVQKKCNSGAIGPFEDLMTARVQKRKLRWYRDITQSSGLALSHQHNQRVPRPHVHSRLFQPRAMCKHKKNKRKPKQTNTWVQRIQAPVTSHRAVFDLVIILDRRSCTANFYCCCYSVLFCGYRRSMMCTMCTTSSTRCGLLW